MCKGLTMWHGSYMCDRVDYAWMRNLKEWHCRASADGDVCTPLSAPLYLHPYSHSRLFSSPPLPPNILFTQRCRGGAVEVQWVCCGSHQSYAGILLMLSGIPSGKWRPAQVGGHLRLGLLQVGVHAIWGTLKSPGNAGNVEVHAGPQSDVNA